MWKILLEGLLQPDATTGRTPLSWLRQAASSHAASPIMAPLTKIVCLHGAGVAPWNLSSRTPNRVQWLAPMGGKSTNQSWQRLAPARRSSVLVAVLQPALLHHTDVVVELCEQCLWGGHSAAKQALEAFRNAGAHSTPEKLTLLRALGPVLLADDLEAPAVRSVSCERVPNKVWQAALDETQGLIRPRPDDAIDCFGQRYSYLRPFVPRLLQTLTRRAQGPDDTVRRAVEVSRDLARVPTRRPVPNNAPLALVPEAWRPYLGEPDGASNRRYYARCPLWHLRSALRSGSVWVEQRRRYAAPDPYRIPPAEWPSRRLAVIRPTGTPSDGLKRLEAREAERDKARQNFRYVYGLVSRP